MGFFDKKNRREDTSTSEITKPDDLSFKDRIKRFGKKFHFDSHHAIERFGVNVAIFAVTGVLLFVGAGYSTYDNSVKELDSTALYTKTFKTSRTEVSGKVLGVYVDPSMTRTMLVFKSGSPDQLPAAASDYKMGLAGTDKNLGIHSIADKPITGSYISFGNNGEYMAAVFDNPDKFDVQILNLTVRVKREIVKKENADPEHNSLAKEDENYRKYDQFRVIFNPGAKGTIKVNLGKAGTPFNVGQVYYDVVTKPEEAKIHTEMESQLALMKAQLAKIDQYMEQTTTTTVDDRGSVLRLKPVEEPAVIAGDKVVGKEASQTKNGKSTLELISSSIVPGGYDFDWRGGNIKKGYIESVVPDGMSYVDFMKQQQGIQSDVPDWQKVPFILSNGTPLTTYTDNDEFVVPLLTLRTNLITAWQTYYEQKSKYQVQMYGDLLKLEISLRNVDANSSVISGKRALKLN